MIECPFWSPARRREVEAAESFESVAEVAIQVLAVMPQPISQLCGPISTGGLGCPKKNTQLFARAVQELRLRGLNPFDQTPLQIGFWRLQQAWQAENGQRYCLPILEVVYRRIFESGYVSRVFFLPGWQTSEGARWERQLVTFLGLEVCDFPPDWYEVIKQEIVLAA